MRESRLAARAGITASVLLVFLVLIQPNHPGGLTLGAFLRFPLELPVILLLLLLARGRARTPVRAAVAGALLVMALVKLADLAANTAYARAFNPVLDLHLLPASWRMLRGAAGLPVSLAAGAGLAIATAGLGWALWRATGRIAGSALPVRARSWLAALVLLALALAGTDAAREIRPFDLPGTALSGRIAWEHVRDGWRARSDLARFRAEAAQDAKAALPADAILPGLRGTDVLLIFVESYGRTALDNPLYGPTVTAALSQTEARLAARGLVMRSAFLTAPMVGGQSWLAHASVLSGLGIGDQGRYAALLASPRRTLLHLAHRAGWHTAAVMPAITLAWPEADYFGYDTVLTAADLGYRGPPFDWVTMPDQFTLAALERRLLGPRPRPPVFAEIALISSHAPWTTIPPILPWDAVGDGRIFAPFAGGSGPDAVWRDPARVREQFRRSLDYVLGVVGAFAERRAADPPLIVVLGDHQPIEFVSEMIGGRDVPIHAIGTPEVIARLAGWGWTPGLVPAPDAPAWPMSAFRDRFLDAFAPADAPAAAPGTVAGPVDAPAALPGQDSGRGPG